MNSFIGLTPPPPTVYQDIGWPLLSNNPYGNLSNVIPPQVAHQQAAASILHSAGPSIPTLADRLETYRQLTATRGATASANVMGNATGATQSLITGLMSSAATANTIVSQSPLGSYTTSLVERTQDLRNWLKQAKVEHEMLNGTTEQGQQANL